VRRFVPLLFLAGCVGAPPTLRLVETKSPSLGGRLVGVDSDGAGGFWLASNDYLGNDYDYYDHVSLHVVHVDAALTELSRYTFSDTSVGGSGIVFTGDALWMNHGGGSWGDTRLRKIDPLTGAEIGSIATEHSLEDVCIRNGHLLASYAHNELVAFDRARGGELYRIELPFLPEGGVMRGVTSNADGIWLFEQETDSVHVVDDRGIRMGLFELPETHDTYADSIDQLAWDGDRLVLAHENQLLFFEVPR
jgi:hypothetical protein